MHACILLMRIRMLKTKLALVKRGRQTALESSMSALTVGSHVDAQDSIASSSSLPNLAHTSPVLPAIRSSMSGTHVGEGQSELLALVQQAAHTTHVGHHQTNNNTYQTRVQDLFKDLDIEESDSEGDMLAWRPVSLACMQQVRGPPSMAALLGEPDT